MRGAQRERCDLAGVRRRPEVFAFVSAPIDTPPALGSLSFNALCGLDRNGRSTYTAEGITKLCEALRGSAVTSLRCVTAHRVFAFVLTPIDTPLLSSFPLQLARQQALWHGPILW